MKKTLLIIGSFSTEEEALKRKLEVREIILDAHKKGCKIVSTGGKNLGGLIATIAEELRKDKICVNLQQIITPRKKFFDKNGENFLDSWRHGFLAEHYKNEVIAIGGGKGTAREIQIIEALRGYLNENHKKFTRL